MKIARIKIKLFIAILFIATIIFLNSGNNNYFKKYFSSFFYYPQLFISKASFSFQNFIQLFYEIKDFRNEKKYLTEENNKLRKQISDLIEIKNENIYLRNALGLPLVKEHKIIDATVIGKDPYNFLDYLLINRGIGAGIEKDMAVADSNGFFIGKIGDVWENGAGIFLVTDSKSAISAIDQNTRVQGLIKSDRNSGLYLDLVSQDAEIMTGDTIITFAAGGDAAALPVAKVISVEKYPNKPFQKIKLFPMADLKKIEKVLIILD